MKVHKSTQKAKEKYERSIYPSNRFGDVEILESLNSKKEVIKFINTGYISEEDWSSIKSGHIRDRSIPTTCGFGYIDIEGASIGRVMTKEYRLWNNMLNRCYNEKSLTNNPTYTNCNVDDRWKYLSAFKEWCSNQIGFEQDSWHLDKDILSKGSKVYSPETCCFIPTAINSLLTTTGKNRGKLPIGVRLAKGGVRYQSDIGKNGKNYYLGTYDTINEAFNSYKEAREGYYKEKAEEWRCALSKDAYIALRDHVVEITD